MTVNVNRSTVKSKCAFCCAPYEDRGRWDCLSCWEVDGSLEYVDEKLHQDVSEDTAELDPNHLHGAENEAEEDDYQTNVLFLICSDCRGLGGNGLDDMLGDDHNNLLVKFSDECTLFQFDAHFGVNY